MIEDTGFQTLGLDPEIEQQRNALRMRREYLDLGIRRFRPLAEPEQVVERLLKPAAHFERLLQNDGNAQRFHGTALFLATEYAAQFIEMAGWGWKADVVGNLTIFPCNVKVLDRHRFQFLTQSADA